MERVLEPELLDSLPADDPRARRSRADLRRINVLMGNARHVARELRGDVRTLLDLGAGDGAFAQRIAREGMAITLLDRVSSSSAAGKFTRVTDDAHSFLEKTSERYDAIIANLFLHHLERDALCGLLERIESRTGLFIACEPRRSRVAHTASRLTWLIGACALTRHDAEASVRAGFSGQELSALWPRSAGWTLSERAAPPFSHLFVARRHAAR